MKYRTVVILLMISVFLSGFFIWQNNAIIVSNYTFTTSKIDDALEGYKIAQISDLHNKEFGKNQLVLLNILKSEKPDIIVITGDLADSRNTEIDKALRFVDGAVKIAPVYYITGNHEYRFIKDDWDRLMQGMEKIGVILLDDKVIHMETESSNGFYLLGLSDNDLSNDCLKALCSQIESDKLQIVLAHEPQYLNEYSAAGVDLVFSGHAHGGQFHLPLIGGIVAPDQGLFPRYTSGKYVEDGTTMVVSRGLGNSVIPVRIFNRPEVVIVELQKT